MKNFHEIEKWYDFYKILPKITFIGLAVIAFIWGIIDSTAIQISGGGYYNTTTYYGTFHSESAFVNWFLWQLVIDIFAAITYCVTKITTSATIMQIELLKMIADYKKPQNTPATNIFNKSHNTAKPAQPNWGYGKTYNSPEVKPTWTCSCGQVNNIKAVRCINCEKDRPFNL